MPVLINSRSESLKNGILEIRGRLSTDNASFHSLLIVLRTFYREHYRVKQGIFYQGCVHLPIQRCLLLYGQCGVRGFGFGTIAATALRCYTPFAASIGL